MEAPLRVALDVSILQAPRTGIGEYAYQLGHALGQLAEPDLVLFDGLRWRDDLPGASHPGYGPLSRIARTMLPGAYRVRRYLLQRRFNRGVKLLCPDVYHQPSLWPLDFDGPVVMTLHDLTHAHYPNTQPANRLKEIERRLPDSLDRASRIMVDSQFIANEAMHYYSLPADKLRIAPLGVAARFHPRTEHQLQPCLASLQLDMRGYYLCIGTLEPRKNLQLAIKAYLGLPVTLRNRMPLLIVGGAGWRREHMDRIPSRAISDGHIRLLGYQGEERVAQLLSGAHALLFPSRYEGFGLPVLEAMASGTPVIACHSAAIPEVAGEAALYADAEDTEGFRAQMLKLLEDSQLHEALRQQGLDRAGTFSWQNCARITVDTYKAARNS